MPPHSGSWHYSAAMDSWSQVTPSGLFQCGPSCKPPGTSETSKDEIHYPVLPKVRQFLYPGGTKRTKRPPRNIRFESEVEIFEINNVRNFPKSQLATMYMTREEILKIHTEAWEMVELMNLGIEYAESNSFSKRGLDDLKEETVDRRRRTREQVYKVVFGMQAMQGGHYSRQMMAELYTQVSLTSKNLAHRTAMYDSIAAGGGPPSITEYKMNC